MVDIRTAVGTINGMTHQTLTLHLPENIYRQLADTAQETDRSVEAEAIRFLQAAMATGQDLPPELDAHLAQLDVLTDEELWRSAEMEATPDENERMQALLEKRQREGLTADEQEQLQLLSVYFKRMMLVRAKAAALLARQRV